MIALAIIGIAFTYIFQDFDFVSNWGFSENATFAVRKALRVLLNDVFMLLFIGACFKDVKVTRLALAIQLIDSFLLLPGYLILKLTLEGDSEVSIPLLSQLHRLIINPTLMILLIPAVYFQKFTKREVEKR
jgi:exosortase F-associated protein